MQDDAGCLPQANAGKAITQAKYIRTMYLARWAAPHQARGDWVC